MQAPRAAVNRLVLRQVGRRNASGHHGPSSTYNDLPSPSGSWQTSYDANQRKYNAHLAMGVGALVGTLVVGKVAGFFEFHNDIPAQPATIKSYK